LAAAHAGCFTMAVSAMLNAKWKTANKLNTEAKLSMEGLNITGIHLYISGQVPGMNAEEFAAVTKDAEKNCLISKALNIPITSESHFEI
jgi:osmotically inducible protein OsmC